MGSRDPHAHQLVVAQLDAQAAAVERLDRAYAGLERRLERINAGLTDVERRAPIQVSPGQLRLVAG